VAPVVSIAAGRADGARYQPSVTSARLVPPFEPDPESVAAIKFATAACGAFRSALDAFRARGFLKISDQMLDYST